MSLYVVTGIDVQGGEVENAIVGLVQKDVDGKTGVWETEEVHRVDLATLIDRDDVYVGRWLDDNTIAAGSRVRLKPGQIEYAMSVDENGVPNDDLMRVAPFSPGKNDGD